MGWSSKMVVHAKPTIVQERELLLPESATKEQESLFLQRRQVDELIGTEAALLSLKLQH